MSAKNTVNQLLARFGFFRDVPVQDAVTPPASKTTTSLQAHDKQYHPNGWKPGDKCRLRDSIFNVDDLTPVAPSSTSKSKQGQGQTSQVQKNNTDFPTEAEFNNLIDLVKSNPRLVPPQLKQTLDDLPGKIFALAENQEYLDAAIADIPDGDAKNSLLADQQTLDKERADLKDEFLRTYRVLASILGTTKPVQLKRNPSLVHDVGKFPTSLDTMPTVNSDGSVDISFDGTSYHFVPCSNGSTGPVEGTININGQPKKFILKLSNKPGIRHPVPAEALKNEQAACEMMRKAGVNAPDSVIFEKNGEVYKLAEFIENSTPISQTTISPDIQRQLREAYPLLDLMYSTDLMKDDNVRVDSNGQVWFVDNGSAFAFKGYGDKKSISNPKWKGFDFEQRNDAAGPDLPGNDGNGGTKNYPSHYGALYEAQPKIQAALGQVSQKDLLKEASRYNMSALVAGLPKEFQSQALIDFAASLDKLSAKAAGTKKIKSSLKQQKAQPPQQQPAQNNIVIPQKLSHMKQDVANALNAAGINLNYMTEVDSNNTYPTHWFIDNYPGSHNLVSTIQPLLPVGYTVASYDDNGDEGITVFQSTDKNKMLGHNWPNGGFSNWADGTASTPSASQPVAQQPSQQSSQSSSTQQIPNSISSGSIPPSISSLLQQIGIQGSPASIMNNGNMYYSIRLPGAASNKNGLQTLAGKLPAGLTLTTHPNGNAYIINTGDYQTYWSGYKHKVVSPSSQSPASSASTASPSQTSSSGTAGSGMSGTSTNTNTTTASTASSGNQTKPISSGSVFPSSLNHLMTQYGQVAYVASNGNNNFVTLSKGTPQQTLQAMSSQLPNGMTIITKPNTSPKIVNTSDLGFWTNTYGGTQVAASSTPAKASTPASNQASAPSQQQTASKPATASTPSGSVSSVASSGGTKTYSYGSSGSLVKSGGFNDGNVATDISNLVSGNNWQSKSGKQLVAPGTKLKTQGSLSNNGDLYVGFPRGTQQSDIANLANQLNGEYQQYGYNVYAMGNWLSIEKVQSAKQTPYQNPSQGSGATSITTPPSQTTQPAPTPSTGSSTTATSGSSPKMTLSQMLQQRLASANPQQQARFQSALNRANGNSGVNPQQSTPSSSRTIPPATAPAQTIQNQTQPASQPVTQSTNSSPVSGQIQTLTAPKSGNQPTPAQQKTISRFQQQIQNARTPAQRSAFVQALSRYYGSI